MARSFDALSSEYLEIDQAVVIVPPFTVAAWFYCTDDANKNTIVFLGDKDDERQMFALRASGDETGDPVSILAYSTADHIAYAHTSSGYSVNTWHHACAVVASSTDRSVFIDGGSEGTNTDEVTPNNLDRTSVGRCGDSSPGYYFAGNVAEVAIWNVALTDAEVALLAAKWSPLFVRPENLAALWALTVNDDDWLGTYDLTAFNTPSWAAHPSGIMYPVKPAVIY